VHSARLGAFSSVNQADAGRVEGASVLFNQPVEPPAGPRRLDTRMDDRVFLLKLVPGVDAGIVDFVREKGYKGLVIEGFGAGGVPNARQDLLDAIMRAVDAGLAVCITTQCLFDGCDIGIYDVGIAAGKAGAVSTFDMTPEAVVTKLMWVLGHTHESAEVQRMLLENYCGEIDPGYRMRLSALVRETPDGDETPDARRQAGTELEKAGTAGPGQQRGQSLKKPGQQGQQRYPRRGQSSNALGQQDRDNNGDRA
jgi:hypothetical protein